MVRETRHLWVGNLPDNIREDRIREHFKRYGRVQNVKLLGRTDNVSTGVGAGGASGICATVAFMDIKSASKAHNAEHILDERTLTTEYYEPAAIPSAAGAPSAGSSPAGSGYSGSSSSVNSTPAPASVSRYQLSGGEDSSSNTCPIAASAAAPATWRGTNDSATEYCRRGNTPASYGRYQRNNSAPYSTPPSNVERTTNRWYPSGERMACATGGESTPSTPGGATEGGRRRRHSGSGSSRSESSSPEPSDTSRASTPATQPSSHHPNHRTPSSLQHQWASTASGRPLAICVRNLPTRSTDSSLKDGLYHEYKKHGKVVWVKVVGQNADRYAVVRFKKPSDVEKAIEVSQDKLFFGCKISVAPHQSCEEDADSAKPYETDIDEYHPKATRTLFIGNLEKDVTQQQLRDKFKHFGRIIEIDIKKGSSGGAGYAFCQYASISSVVEAIRSMDGEYVGGSRVKLGFGKPVATTCVWVDGLTEHTEKQVLSAVSRCGGATSVCVDRAAGAALVHFEQAAAAGAAVRELRRVAAAVSAAEPDHPRLCVDYASRECQEAFYEQLEKHGGTAALTGSERLTGDLTTRYLPPTRLEPVRFDGSRSRASSYGRGSSRTPRYSTLEHFDQSDYAADRRYRVYDEVGSSPQPEDANYEERLQSVVVSPHRARRHRRDSSPDDRKHSKERHRSVGTRRSRSGSRGGERHGARRRHRRRRDGSGSHSRAGTPLRDELDALPTEPRRMPRERPPLPMCLPLPKFAAQLLRTAPPTPRPTPAPAPDSPPRPPSASSSSGGSAPHSPSLEERIRSLDEKLNGSRVLSDTPDRARLRHRLLDIDINEVKPSEVVRSLLAKRSVFDEDSERLEGAVRPPSPSGSPLNCASTATPRALRYPFPTHPMHQHQLVLPSVDNTTHDSDGDSCESASGLPRLVMRPCPRTPPPPPSGLDSPQDQDRVPREHHDVDHHDVVISPLKKHKSDCLQDLSTVVNCLKENCDEEPPRVCRDRNKDYSAASTSLNTQIIDNDSKPPITEISTVKSDIFSKDYKKDIHIEDDSAREVMEMLIKQVENFTESQKFESLFNKKNCGHENLIKTALFKDDRFNVDGENKIDMLSQNSNHKSIENHEKQITKELMEFEMQHSHLNTITLIKSCNADVSSDVFKNIEKVRQHNYHNTKQEKENINSFDNSLDKETKLNNVSLQEKRNTDSEKPHDECLRIDREKTRHSKEKIDKDRHETEKDKTKICKSEKNIDKERKPKEDQHCEKHINDKIEKAKSEKDIEKIIKEKHDKDDKLKHSEDKSYKHDHHKKDRSERDKRKDSIDIEVTSTKLKKEDKHRYDKKKEDCKRDSRKDSENMKIRKSSRDESSRDCRKDSTDSSTSRASHESSKIKDMELNETKDDMKTKCKYTELFSKRDPDIESSLKVENKDQKDGIHNRHKIDSCQEQVLKTKADVSEKQRHYSLDSPNVDSKRKERLNSCSSLPSNIGHKRRMSSQDSIDLFNEDVKKCKSDAKTPERRNSKDSRSDRHKTTKFSKGHFAKIIESKTKDDKKNQVKPPDESYIEFKENDSKDPKIADRLKSLKKCNKDETLEKCNTDIAAQGLHNDLDFLATLELRSSEEDERQRALRKEMKEKKRIQQLQQIQELQMQQDALHQAEIVNKIKDEKKVKCDEKKKEAAREKRLSTDRKSKDEKIDSNKRKSRKPVHSSDSSDSDEPKKHSIFDIIDDGPTYISMYDKVKARSCKNMQKQEEEKRQEKIKAKFCQLKQSRAKREEKKRSSWDEDSDSDQDGKKYHKSSMDNSSDDDIVIHTKKREKSNCFDHDHDKTDDYFDGSTNEEDMRNKLSRKNSRTRIMSDTSDDETSKRSSSKSPTLTEKIKKESLSDSDSTRRIKNEDAKDSNDSNSKKNSLLNLFGKSDSDDSRIKSNLENESDFKCSYNKSIYNDFSSESESACNKNSFENRKKHKKRQKKHKSSYSDDDMKIENSDTTLLETYKQHKNIEKLRRHSNKKDKRKDKLRESVDTDDTREEKYKIKREKKSVSNNYDTVIDSISNTLKKDGKMEDIFGPLSDESDRDSRGRISHKPDFSTNDIDSSFCSNTDYKIKDNDRRKREKKRKENKYLKDDDNSLDVDAVSKAIEARLLADSLAEDDSRIRVEAPVNCNKIETNIKYNNDGNLISEAIKHEKQRKDFRERKKKKKKNREDRQNRKDHHHFYHHEKVNRSDHVGENITTSPKTMLLDIPLPNDVKAVSIKENNENSKLMIDSHSLPRLTDSPPIVIQSDENTDSKSVDSNNVVFSDSKLDYIESKEIEIEEIPMPPPIETIVTDISDVPLPKDPLPSKLNQSREDSFLSNLNSDRDFCEDAVRNITNSEKEIENIVQSSDIVDNLSNKIEKKPEEKPRAIISQEETEDAVAALLGESFGGNINTFSSYEETENNTTHTNEIESATIENENIPEEDAEEMRQAVQNLNASEMEIKPDTPVSDSDLLLIDTDTEETDETQQDSTEKIPSNIISNQAVNCVPDQNKREELTNTNISERKPSLEMSSTTAEVNVKINDDLKIQLPKKENVQIISSTATPVITSWTVSNNKLVEPQVLNIQANSIASKEKNELKPTHITANIVQIKGPNQAIQISNNTRPVMTQQARLNAPYQVINSMIRTQSPNIQPPTIKIPEPHIMYQKPQGIVISPRMSIDPRMQSPKTNSQNDSVTSPRVANMAIISSSSPNLNSVGLASPNSIQQRSPGHVTVVRMQQPPLSPIQTMHIPHGTRTMLSPSRPNSVLVQTQGPPLHFNRLPVTPVLAPISKPINVNNLIQQNKGIGVTTTTPLIHQQKVISGESRKTEQRNMSENSHDNSKIILSPTSIQHSTNPTVMAQNRLISMQNAIHVTNINTVHLNNKVLINTVSQINDKRENQSQKSDKVNHISYGSTPIIHVAGVNNATSIIKSGTKSVVSNSQEINTNNRSQASNVIHSLSAQRVLTQPPLSNVIKIDTNKVPTPVLSLATIRTSVPMVAKLESSSTVTSSVTSTSTKNVSPLLLQTTSTIAPVRLNTKLEDINETISNPLVFQSHSRENESKVFENDVNKPIVTVCSTVKEQKEINPVKSPIEFVTKCETDFEELLKDNTNEIKVTNDPDKKLEVNVGNTVTLITTSNNNRDKDRLKDTDYQENIEDIKLAKTQTFSDLGEDKNSQTKDSMSLQIDNNTYQSSRGPEFLDNSELFHSKVIKKPESEIIDKLNILEDPGLETLMHESDLSNNAVKLDENDSWSAKDVNIESVIKTVDSLCNENVDMVLNSDVKSKDDDSMKVCSGKETNLTHVIKSTNNQITEDVPDSKLGDSVTNKIIMTTATVKRGGRNIRGKKNDKNLDRVQTRQIAKPRGATSNKRGRGRAKVDRKIKNMINSSASTMPGDVYDFHEDSGDETVTSPNKNEGRPRLILTIKSPLSGNSTVTTTSTLSINQKDQIKVDKNKDEKNDEFISPSPNTRKSRRLQEKDVQRSFVDDIIEDVIKGSTGQARTSKETCNKKRPTRQAIKANHEKIGSDTRKSPRGAKRMRDQSLSDTSMDSGDERTVRDSSKDSKAPRLDGPVNDSSDPTAITRSPLPIVIPSVSNVIPGALVASPAPAAPVATVPVAAVPIHVPTTTSTPITKPPKKMISEISAKLAGAFDVVIAANPVERTAIEAPASPLAQSAGDARPRRLADAVPGALVPVGATEATDARVQSPALPHRPPSAPSTPTTHRQADRAAPLLIRSVARAAGRPLERPLDERPPTSVFDDRGGESEGASGASGSAAAGGAAAGAAAGGAAGGPARALRPYAATASLPRGAHHPPHPPPDHLKQLALHHHPGAASRVTIASVPAISPQGQLGMGDGMYPHFSHQHYQMYQQHFRATQHDNRTTPSPYTRSLEAEGSEAPTSPLELRRPPSARVPAGDYLSASPEPPERRDVLRRAPPACCPRPLALAQHAPHAPLAPHAPHAHTLGPPHASQVPREADSLQMLLRRYPVMWQGLLALKNDSAAVQMHFVGGNPRVAGDTLSRHADGSTPLLRIAQRMRLEQPQLDQVHRKMKLEHEHCMLLALPCGRDHMDVLQQSNNLTAGFITYLQCKQAAGIVNIAPPGHQQAMFTVHIFPSCEFANENLNRIAPDLMHRVADIAHLLIVIATV